MTTRNSEDHDLSAVTNSLVQWVNTFDDLCKPCQKIEDLADGVLLYQILSQIDSAHFDFSTVAQDAEDNWALRSSNLKKLVKGVGSYYEEVIGHSAGDLLNSASLSDIAQDNDAEELVKLVEVVLSVVVQCEDRGTYIENIMGMEEAAQAELMYLIESVMKRVQALSSEAAEAADVEELTARVRQLELELSSSEEERGALQRRVAEEEEVSSRTVEELKEKVGVLEEEKQRALDSVSSNEHVVRQNEVQQQQSLAMKEAQLQDVQAQLIECEQAVEEARREGQERAARLEADNRRVADELDIMQERVASASRTEAALGKAKRKLEEAELVRQQVVELEEANNTYQDRLVDMESKLKEMNSLKDMLEKYRNEKVELETKRIESEAAAGVAARQIAKLKAEVNTTQQAKAFVEEQLESLEEEVKALKEDGGGAQDIGGGSLGGLGGLGGSGGVMELREQVKRLQRENEELRKGGGGGEGSSSVELDDARRLAEVMQKRLADLQQQNADREEEAESLRAEVKALQESKGGDASAAASAAVSAAASTQHAAALARLREENEALVARKQQSDAQLSQLNAKLEQRESQYLEAAQKAQSVAEAAAADDTESYKQVIHTLTQNLKEKESEVNSLSAQREKLETYIKKTLVKIQGKFQTTTASHQAQLARRQEKIDQLEELLNSNKQAHRRENRLMASAIYSMGIEVQRRAIPKGFESSGNGAAGASSDAGRPKTPQSWAAREREKQGGGSRLRF